MQITAIDGSGRNPHHETQHMSMSDLDTSLPPAPLQAAMEAAYAALHRDAASAHRRLRQPVQRERPQGTPHLWDASPIDARPDDCWRCDAASSTDALGLCPTCRNVLAGT
jgi:hypothetical protein